MSFSYSYSIEKIANPVGYAEFFLWTTRSQARHPCRHHVTASVAAGTTVSAASVDASNSTVYTADSSTAATGAVHAQRQQVPTNHLEREAALK